MTATAAPAISSWRRLRFGRAAASLVVSMMAMTPVPLKELVLTIDSPDGPNVATPVRLAKGLVLPRYCGGSRRFDRGSQSGERVAQLLVLDIGKTRLNARRRFRIGARLVRAPPATQWGLS